MAAGTNARSDKHSTIAFTLPISCQICLGKVKQPVLCSNNHVFCSPCMNVWLLRSKHCPACRTPINPNNPVKQIKGGLNQCQDDKDKITNPDLRKARFELLYREYEDEFEKLQSENMLLKTENDILKTQASRSGSGTSKSQDPAKGEFRHPNTVDSNKLLMLTKRLQDAQKLYDKLKDDMSRVKQENGKLKDENVNLNRENEKLRIEISNRSPHRYGRYTVATLESKVESYEKEVRQLNKALERSDQYIENLEKELETHKQTKSDDKYSVTVKPQSYLRDLDLDNDGESLGKYALLANSNTKRELFGDDEQGKDLKSMHNGVKEDDGLGKLDHATKSVTFGKPSDSHSNHVSSTKHLAASYPGSLTKSLSERQKATLDWEMSTGHAMSASVRNESESQERNVKSSTSPSKSPKKVSFALPKKDNSPSFDLDQPSPLMPTSFLEKANSDYSHSTSKHNSKFDLPHTRNTKSFTTASSNVRDGDTKKSKPILKAKYSNDSSDNSRLSEPDLNTTPVKRRDDDSDLVEFGLDDTQTIQSELDDLNISLTPELSDCMKLLNRAEKKVHSHEHMAVGSSVSDSHMTGTLTIPCTEVPSSTTLSNLRRDSTSNAEYFSLDSSSQNKGNADYLYSSYAGQPSNYKSVTKHDQPYNTFSGDSLKGWQNEYFRKVDANPYGDPGHTLYGDVDRSKYPSTSDLGNSYPSYNLSKESFPKQSSHVEIQSSASRLDEKIHQLGIGDNSKNKMPNLCSVNSGNGFKSVHDSLGLHHSSLNEDPLKDSYLYGTGVKDFSLDTKSSKRYSSLTDIPAATYSTHSEDLLKRSSPQSFSHTDLLSNARIRKYSSLTNLPTGSAAAPTFLAHSALPIPSSNLLPTDHIPTLSGLLSHQSHSLHSSLSSQSLPLSNQSKGLSLLSSQSRAMSFLQPSASSNHNFSLSLTGAAPTIPSSLPSSFASDILHSYPAVTSSNAFTSSLPYGNSTSSSYTSALTSDYGSSSSYLSNQGRLEMAKVPTALSAIQELNKKGNYSYVSNTSHDLSSRNSDSFLPEPKKRLFDSSDDFDLSISMSPIKATRVL